MFILLMLLTMSGASELDRLVNEINKGKGYEVDAYEFCTIIDKTPKGCKEVLGV